MSHSKAFDIISSSGTPIFSDIQWTIADPERLNAYKIALDAPSMQSVLGTVSLEVLEGRFNELVHMLSYGQLDSGKISPSQLEQLLYMWSEVFFDANMDFFIGALALDNSYTIMTRSDEMFGMRSKVTAMLAGVPTDDILGK